MFTVPSAGGVLHSGDAAYRKSSATMPDEYVRRFREHDERVLAVNQYPICFDETKRHCCSRPRRRATTRKWLAVPAPMPPKNRKAIPDMRGYYALVERGLIIPRPPQRELLRSRTIPAARSSCSSGRASRGSGGPRLEPASETIGDRRNFRAPSTACSPSDAGQ